MRAVQYYGAGDIRLENIPEPVTAKGQVKIKVAWCGICGSDVHSYYAPTPVSPTATEAHPVTGETLPITMGHEFSGIITEVGAEVDSKFAIGQRVVVEPVLSCMKPTCAPCCAGSRNVCPHITFIGIGGWGGGLAEYISVKQEFVHILPDSISLELGAMIEPLSIAWHALKRSAFVPGSTALIIGAGPIGLLLLKCLQAQGASWVGISEPAVQRRATAAQLSASAVFDPRATDVPAATYAATNGVGADIVFDCAGIQVSLDTAIKAARARGNIVEVAVWEKDPILNISALQSKEILFTATIGCDREHPELIQAMADGKFPGLEDLITRKIPLEDFMERGLKALIEDKDTQIKILVRPSTEWEKSIL